MPVELYAVLMEKLSNAPHPVHLPAMIPAGVARPNVTRMTAQPNVPPIAPRSVKPNIPQIAPGSAQANSATPLPPPIPAKAQGKKTSPPVPQEQKAKAGPSNGGLQAEPPSIQQLGQKPAPPPLPPHMQAAAAPAAQAPAAQAPAAQAPAAQAPALSTQVPPQSAQNFQQAFGTATPAQAQAAAAPLAPLNYQGEVGGAQPAAPSAPVGNAINKGMDAVRGGVQSLRENAARNRAALSPENAQALQDAGATAKRWGRRALKGGLAAGGLYAGYRMLGGGGRAADEQTARMQDYYANAEHQMGQPLPSMTVQASYDEFANAKVAELDKQADPVNTFGGAHGAMSTAFGKALADKLVTEPIDNAHRFLKKKIVEDPKAHATFHSVIQEDPMLQDAYASNPAAMEDTFKAMRKFGPSMSTSPAVVRSFLRQSTMAGNNMDFATIRLLAETEKFVQNARGRGT